MFSRKSTFRSGPPKMMKSSGGDEEAAVVVIVLLMCCVFVAFAGFWYTSRVILVKNLMKLLSINLMTN